MTTILGLPKTANSNQIARRNEVSPATKKLKHSTDRLVTFASKMELQYVNTSEDDFDALVELRIEAMRESLEKIGRFNRERSIERFRSSFAAADTKRILCDNVLLGFYSLASKADHLFLSHLYVKPNHQRLGIGSLAMKEIIELSNEAGLPIRLGALKESKSNDFYQKHGFVVTAEDEWDIYYERIVHKKSSPCD